jgi:hypothetical protein
MNNPLSFSSIKLDRFSKDGVQLKPASGFVVKAGNRYYLITNWHVVSGMYDPTHKPRKPVIEPYLLKTAIHFHMGEGEKKAPLTMGRWNRLTIQLYDENDAPKWIELQANNQQQLKIDVIAIPLESNLKNLNFLQALNRIAVPRKFADSMPRTSNVSSWHEISAIFISAIETDIEYGPSDAVDVIGYPIGWAPTGSNKATPAFWRRSSIASEIIGLGIGTTSENPFFIDPCPLEGMTGSPVIGVKNDCLKLLGIYSDKSTAGFGANAGLVWNASVIKELIGTP